MLLCLGARLSSRLRNPSAASRIYPLMRTSLLLTLLLTFSLVAAVSNMGGTWVLNPKRSRFADGMHPGNVTLTIQHNDPKLKYDGTTDNPEEGQYRDFHFDGAIDGKEYVVRDADGDHRMTLKRVNDRVIESDTKTAAGEIKSRITISHDGNTLERRMSWRGNDGKTRSWVEIYEKKK